MTNSLLERARRGGNPVIDGDQATFVWHGDLPPMLIGDFTDWADRPVALEESAPDIWTATLTFPPDSYLEYAFSYPFRAGEDDTDIDERILDPFNLHVIWNGVNAVNQYFAMPGFQPSPLTKRAKDVRRGKISEHILAGGGLLGGGHRNLYLYHPPVTEPTPLVVVWDGPDYLHRAYLNIIVDNLIAQKRIRPIALAMIENAQAGRFAEYLQNEATVGFAVRTLLAYAHKHLNLLDEQEHPGIHSVLGASMGGLMALYAGIRAPQVFGKVISQSGAFFIDDTSQSMLIDELIRMIPTAPIKIWQDVGVLEWLLTGNRKMHDLLIERQYDVTYHEFSGGHNYTMWSQTVSKALESVYGFES